MFFLLFISVNIVVSSALSCVFSLLSTSGPIPFRCYTIMSSCSRTSCSTNSTTIHVNCKVHRCFIHQHAILMSERCGGAAVGKAHAQLLRFGRIWFLRTRAVHTRRGQTRACLETACWSIDQRNNSEDTGELVNFKPLEHARLETKSWTTFTQADPCVCCQLFCSYSLDYTGHSTEGRLSGMRHSVRLQRLHVCGHFSGIVGVKEGKGTRRSYRFGSSG